MDLNESILLKPIIWPITMNFQWLFLEGCNRLRLVDRKSFRVFDLPSFYLDTLYSVSFTFTYTLPCGFTLHGRIRMTYFLRLMPRPHRQGIEEFGSIEIVEGPTLCYCDDFSQLLEFWIWILFILKLGSTQGIILK